MLLSKKRIFQKRFIVILFVLLFFAVFHIWIIMPVIYPYGYSHYIFGITVSQLPCNPASEKYYLTISTIVKDRAHYMAEWVEFHLMHGVEHFYIYDNESTDNLTKVLHVYIKQSLVTIIPFPNAKPVYLIDGNVEIMTQKFFLRDTIETHKCETRWMAMIDSDEFVFSSGNTNLASTLQRYEPYASVVIPWLMFTSNGWVTKPPSDMLVIEAYTTRWKKTQHMWKHILQPKRVKSVYSCHNYKFVSGYQSVNENMTPFANWPGYLNGWLVSYFYTNDIWYPYDVLRLHHYKTKSATDWEDRLRTGEVSGQKIRDSEAHWEEFFKLQNVESVQDKTMIQYVKPLQVRLRKRLEGL